jgi:serine/threonine-protein kinase
MDEAAKLEAAGDLEGALLAYSKHQQWAQAARVAARLGRNGDAGWSYLKADQYYEAAVCFQKERMLNECLDSLLKVPATSPRYRAASVHAIRVTLTLGAPVMRLSPFIVPFIHSPPTSQVEAAALNQLAHAFAALAQVRLARGIYQRVLAAVPPAAEGDEPPPRPAPPVPAALARPVSGKGQRGPRLGDALVARGKVTPAQLKEVQRSQPNLTDLSLGDALIHAGLVTELDVLRALSEQSGIPFISEAKLLATAAPAALKALTQEQVQRWSVVPVALVNKQLYLAMRDPGDVARLDQIRFATGERQATGVYATESSIRKAIQKFYLGGEEEAAEDWKGKVWEPVSSSGSFAEPADGAAPSREFDTREMELRAVQAAQAESGAVSLVPPAPPIAQAKVVTQKMGATAAPQEPPVPGNIFASRYQLEALLGEGGSALVYRALDLELNEPVALKLFRASAIAENLLARFKRELSLSRQITHPNIIRLFDMGAHEGWRYLTMELLEGMDLQLWMESLGHPVPLLAGVSFLEQACRGLQAAHEKGVIHRDVKPQNLFITHDGVVKVMDFGIAKKEHSPGVTVEGMIAGTPEYISPEQINGFSTVTALTDLYALGATAYTIFTGRPPFVNTEVMAILMAHVNQPVPSPRLINPDIPPELAAIILRLLEKDPARRYQSCLELGDALARFRLSITPAPGVLAP